MCKKIVTLKINSKYMHICILTTSKILLTFLSSPILHHTPCLNFLPNSSPEGPRLYNLIELITCKLQATYLLLAFNVFVTLYRLSTKLREVMFSVVSVCGGSHVTITHDALDLTIQGPPGPAPQTCSFLTNFHNYSLVGDGYWASCNHITLLLFKT